MVGLVYNRTHGWRVHKRPYLDDFLDYLALSGLYELVVFANGYQFSIEPVLDKIDPLVLTSRGLQMRFAMFRGLQKCPWWRHDSHPRQSVG